MDTLYLAMSTFTAAHNTLVYTPVASLRKEQFLVTQGGLYMDILYPAMSTFTATTIY